jgi:hypothetical protein
MFAFAKKISSLNITLSISPLLQRSSFSWPSVFLDLTPFQPYLFSILYKPPEIYVKQQPYPTFPHPTSSRPFSETITTFLIFKTFLALKQLSYNGREKD